MKDTTINYIEDFIKNDYSLLKDNLELLVKEYTRKSKRLDKIIKQSDSQQRRLMELNDTITKHQDQLCELNRYNIQQQNIAKEKLDATIVNSLLKSQKYNVKVIYKSSDILSGDFYSIHTLADGSVLTYILDGQGHGISPAMTVFAISSTIESLVTSVQNFQEMVEKLFPMIQKFLGEEEQLSYIMINIKDEDRTLSYIGGGTYPFLIQQDENVKRFKANNLPFMNFSQTPVINKIDAKWDKLFLYTDGFVEDIDENLAKYKPELLLKSDQKLEEAREIISKNSYDDDITIIKIE